MWRKGEFLGVCHAPPQGSGTPALTNLGVSLPHMSYTAEFGRVGSNGNALSPNYQIFVITDMGRGLFPGGEPRSVPKGQSPSAPSYWGSALSITTLFKEERPWCLFFFCLFIGHAPSPEQRAFEGCIVRTSITLPFIARFRRGFQCFFRRDCSFR